MTISAKRLAGRPPLRFVFGHPAHAVAFGFGAGLVPVSPGTAGTALGWPIFWLLDRLLDGYGLLAAIALLFGVGVWACGRTGTDLGVHDYGGLVWDETVAFLLVLFFAPPGLAWQLAGFALFRFFDIVKPPPIGYFDRRIHGGLGVMVDDLMAAFYTLLCLALGTGFWSDGLLR